MKLYRIIDVVEGIARRVGAEIGCYIDIYEKNSGCEIRNFSEFGNWEVMVVTPEIVEDFFPAFTEDILEYEDAFKKDSRYKDDWEFSNIPEVIEMLKTVPEWKGLVDGNQFLHYTTQDIVDLYKSQLQFIKEGSDDSAR